MRPRWPQLRALLILAHLLAITLMALPAPVGGMNRSAWSDPTVQSEIRAWSERLDRLGLEQEPEELEESLWQLARRAMRLRSTILRPLRPYYRLCGTTQSWRMFVAPHRFPARLQIRVEEAEGWRVIYEARSPIHTWNRRQLDNDRMRAALFRYGWRHYRRTWRQFATWLGEAALEDHPEARRVELRYLGYRSPSPAEVLAGQEPERKPRLRVVVRRQP